MENMKKMLLTYGLEIDIPHCSFCFKSLIFFVYSSPILYSGENGRSNYSPLGTGRHVFLRYEVIGMPINMSPPKME